MKIQPSIILMILVFLVPAGIKTHAVSVPGDHANHLYVSPNGHDRNPGTLLQPYKTPGRALKQVKELLKTSAQGSGGITIWLRGGDYMIEEPLDLGKEDSGTPVTPVSWKAYENEQPRFLGGKILKGFSRVTDSSILARLDPKARNQVLFVNLKASGISDFGSLKSRGFGRPVTPSHGELFFGGKPMNLAQWPNKSQWEKIAGFPTDGAKDDGHGTIMGDLKAGFFYAGDRPNHWKDISNLWIHGYWAYDWANSYEQVASVDTARKLIQTLPPYGNYAFMKGQRYCYLNILEELDEPGEWFLDQASGNLYFWPPAPVESAEAVFSTFNHPFFRLLNTHDIHVEGIRFEATRANAIEIQGGERNRIISCYLCNIGNGGILIDGGTNHGVINCEITDTGDGGITLVGGDRQTLTPSGHFVENCHFQRQARWSVCYAPAISMTGVGMRASHNLIHDHPHCAILFWGNDHLIEYNDIHHVAMETGDVGAIYTGRDYTFRGNRIIYNYIHETGGVGMGSMGVYMDDCVSGTEVYGNIFYKVHWAMFIGGGRDHRVINNLFVECDPAIRADGRGIDPSPVWFNMVNKTMRERMKDVPLELYRAHYPEIKNLDPYYGTPDSQPNTARVFKGIPPEGNRIERNICYGRWKEIAWYAKEDLFIIRDNYVSSDLNGIGDPASGFRIPPDSPARTIGFQEIPFREIGRR